MDPATYLTHARAYFTSIRRRADRALEQVAGNAFFTQIDSESNSLAHLVKHLAGNMRSRWTAFLTTDGEKPDRRRDDEFVLQPHDTREHLIENWEAGWATLFSALEALADQDLSRTVTIRGEPHSVFEAIERQKDHYAYHAGQIVFLARHLVGPAWKTLSIPRGASEAYHAALRAHRGGHPGTLRP